MIKQNPGNKLQRNSDTTQKQSLVKLIEMQQNKAKNFSGMEQKNKQQLLFSAGIEEYDSKDAVIKNQIDLLYKEAFGHAVSQKELPRE